MTIEAIGHIPYSAGMLEGGDQQLFSQEFQHDWGPIKVQDRLVDYEKISVGEQLDRDDFGLPEAYLQFVPAITIAAAHERSVRQDLRLRSALLTVRQKLVPEGQSHQDGWNTGTAHQDSDGTYPGRFYTVSDEEEATTKYCPDIPPLPTLNHWGGGSVKLGFAGQAEPVSFGPYEVVHASTLTYHYSPPMARRARRTFMRLSFEYEAA